jgi:hypothetical protein
VLAVGPRLLDAVVVAEDEDVGVTPAGAHGQLYLLSQHMTEQNNLLAPWGNFLPQTTQVSGGICVAAGGSMVVTRRRRSGGRLAG